MFAAGLGWFGCRFDDLGGFLQDFRADLFHSAGQQLTGVGLLARVGGALGNRLLE
jgi:hypothetical protein